MIVRFIRPIVIEVRLSAFFGVGKLGREGVVFFERKLNEATGKVAGHGRGAKVLLQIAVLVGNHGYVGPRLYTKRKRLRQVLRAAVPGYKK
jgi:hypothetical protein